MKTTVAWCDTQLCSCQLAGTTYTFSATIHGKEGEEVCEGRMCLSNENIYSSDKSFLELEGVASGEWRTSAGGDGR